MPLIADAQRIYTGSTPAQRVYAGATKVWPMTFSPPDLPGLVGWFDADDPAAFVYSSAAEISQWTNKGSGLSFANANVATQPTRIVGQAGRSVVSFDSGVGDMLENASFVANDPYTEYLALWCYGASYETVHGSGYVARNQLHADTAEWYFNLPAGNNRFPVAASDNNPMQWTFRVPGGAGQQEVFRNGVLASSIASNGGWGIDNGLRLSRMDGQEIWRSFFYQYFELLIYEGYHDDPTRLQVEQYLRAKWALP
jgi:hypothetical protein